MNQDRLINATIILANQAQNFMWNGLPNVAKDKLLKLLELLMIELVGGASNETQTKIDNASS